MELVGKIYNSNNFGEFKVLEKLTKEKIIDIKGNLVKKKIVNYLIEFLESHNKYDNATKYSILHGNVEDSLYRDFLFESKIWKQNCGDSLKILRKLENGYYECEFINLFYIGKFGKKEIQNGQCLNPRIEEENFINKIWLQSCGDSLKILNKTNKKSGTCFYWECEFIKYPCKILALKDKIVSGKVFNPNYPNEITGFYLGIGKYSRKEYCSIYNVIEGIHKRCYIKENPAYKNYGEKGIICCEEWHNFQNFCEWYLINSNWTTEFKLDLDKDIISNIKHLKTKIYSPDTCLLIPIELNGFLTGDNWECGIKFYKEKNIFIANFTFDYITRLSEGFTSFKEAKLTYAKEKYKYWTLLINKYNFPIELKNKLLKYDFSWEWIWSNLDENKIKENKNLILNINHYK